MAITFRRDLTRNLTAEEADGNFDHLLAQIGASTNRSRYSFNDFESLINSTGGTGLFVSLGALSGNTYNDPVCLEAGYTSIVRTLSRVTVGPVIGRSDRSTSLSMNYTQIEAGRCLESFINIQPIASRNFLFVFGIGPMNGLSNFETLASQLGVYFSVRVQGGVLSHFEAQAFNGTTRTRVSLGTPPTTWAVFKIKKTPTSFIFFVDGVQVAEIDTNIPTSATLSYGWNGWQGDANGGLIRNNILIDWIASYIEL